MSLQQPFKLSETVTQPRWIDSIAEPETLKRGPAVAKHRLCVFLPARRYASAILAFVVCLSVRLSQVGVLLRRLNTYDRAKNAIR